MLTSPFDGLPRVFGLDSYQLSGPGLITNGNVLSGREHLIPSKITSEGDVEIEGTFTMMTGTAAGARFGWALCVGNHHGHTFMLSSSGQTRPERFTMSVHRDKIILRETDVEVAGATVRLLARKKRAKLGFAIGKTELG